MKNIQDTLMSQYANSQIICSLINGLNDCLDPEGNIQDFYDLAFNVMTAKGFGLDIWGEIVGVSRNVPTPVDQKEDVFGFKTEPQSYSPFNVSPFNYGESTDYASFLLMDKQYREIVLIKAAANIVLATAPNINKFLKMIFEDKRAYFLITGHMKASYVFEFNLSSFQRNIAYNLNILPRPSGVLLGFNEVSVSDTFGFLGSELQPFNQGVFIYG